MTEPIKF